MPSREGSRIKNVANERKVKIKKFNKSPCIATNKCHLIKIYFFISQLATLLATIPISILSLCYPYKQEPQLYANLRMERSTCQYKVHQLRRRSFSGPGVCIFMAFDSRVDHENRCYNIQSNESRVEETCEIPSAIVHSMNGIKIKWLHTCSKGNV